MLTSHASKDAGNSADDGGPSGRESATGKTCREWLGLRELTQYADISERTLRSWIYSPVDPLPAAKVCGKVLVRKSDFDAYLQRHRIKRLEEINLDAIVQDVIKGVAHGR
jgi:Helix-turn-helix domain